MIAGNTVENIRGGRPMNAVTIILPFDYAVLPAEVADKARTTSERIRTLLRQFGKTVIETGRELCAAKELVGHGNFNRWLLVEFNMTARTATNYMGVYEGLGAISETVSDLRATTLYLLASPSTPSAIKIEVIGKLKAGEVLDDQTIKSMVADARAEAELAKLSPKRRKSRDQREVEGKRRREERRQERERKEAASALAVEFLITRLGKDFAEFARLCKDARYFSDAIEKATSRDGATESIAHPRRITTD